MADIDGVADEDNRVLFDDTSQCQRIGIFPYIWPEMEDGIFPSYMTITSDDPEEIEEKRRLAYVGITRAKEDLTLTCARARMIRGETQYNMVSRFLNEIPGELIPETCSGQEAEWGGISAGYPIHEAVQGKALEWLRRQYYTADSLKAVWAPPDPQRSAASSQSDRHAAKD